MRTLKLIMTLAFVSLTSIASAQFVSSTSGSSSFIPEEIESSYSRAYIGYNMMSIDWDPSSTSNGITIGYLHANNITGCKLPLYVEYGLEAIWNNFSEKDEDRNGSWETETNFITLSIPVNIAYKFMVPNTGICASPYLGVNVKAHLSGKTSYRGEENGSQDFFEDEGGKRCQVGMNIGLGISYKNIYIGYRFQPDFIPIVEGLKEYETDTKTYSNMISVGYCF